MRKIDIPFNVELLILTDSQIKSLSEISSLDVHQTGSKEFHPNGLFSSEIFGRVGDDTRNLTHAYIPVNDPLLHPLIYMTLTEMKMLYKGILNGTMHAEWDPDIKDFTKSTVIDGETGYSFFMKYIDEIKFPEDKEGNRKFYIQLQNKYKHNNKLKYIPVIPAGYRDYSVGSDGRKSEDEINDLYRKLLTLNNLSSSASNDELQFNKQLVINDIYLYVESLLKGKKKLIKGDWASRKVFNGTLNVITSTPVATSSTDDKAGMSFNETIMGLYQYLKSLLPISVKHIRDGIISDVFTGEDGIARVIDSTTYKPKKVRVSNQLYNQWTSNDGIEKLIDKFAQISTRYDPVMVGENYLALICFDSDGNFFITNEQPRSTIFKEIRPITLAELLYYSVCHHNDKYPAITGRYPVDSDGTTYPTKIYLKPTLESVIRKELNYNGYFTGKIARAGIVIGSNFINSVTPHLSKLENAGGDFDGDQMTATILYTEESIKEIDALLGSREFYISADNKLKHGMNIETVNYLLRYMSKGMEA